MWIIEGGRVQQAAVGGLSSAFSSMSRKSLGRSSTHTLSSLSTAKPVTPPIFHLLGMVFGQSGSNLYFGAAGACAPSAAQKTNKPRPANAADALVRRLRSIFLFMAFTSPPVVQRHRSFFTRLK